MGVLYYVHIQVVKREYKDWKQILSTPLYFEAESNALSIDIPAEGDVISEAWKIFPSSTPLMVGYYNFSDPTLTNITMLCSPLCR